MWYRSQTWLICKLVFIFLILFCADFIALAESKTAPTAQIETLAVQSSQAMFRWDFDSAHRILEEVRALDPSDPLPTFGAMSIEQLKMLENFDYRHKAGYDQSAQESEEKCDQLARQIEGTQSWQMFVCAAAYGLMGFEAIRQHEYLEGLRLAKKGHRLITAIREHDPNFIDAKLGEGLYLYWRSYFTNKLKFLPFFKDNRAQGIALIKEVMAQGRLGKELARSNMIFVYLAEKDYTAAESLTLQLMQDYPQNPVFPVFHVRALIQLKKYDQAEAEISAFIARFPQVTTARYWQAVIAYRRERWDEAVKLAGDFLLLDLPQEYVGYAYHLQGLVYEKMQDKKLALKAYKAAYRADDTLDESLQAIVRLRRKG